LLLVVDLTQIQHRALHGPAVGKAAILDYAEVAVNPLILLSLSAAQKHRKPQDARNRGKRKGPTVFIRALQVFLGLIVLQTKEK